MFYQYHVFVTFGILALSLVSGVEIEGIKGKRTFLEGAGINLTCSHSTSTDMSNKLMFSIPSVTGTNYTKTRSFDSNTKLSTLVISKDKVMEGDTGTYTCKFDGSSDERSVSIEVFKDTKEKDQKNFKTTSSVYTEGEKLELLCPILSALMANVTWSRDVTPELEKLERASYSVDGTTTTNGKLTITDLTPEDRGHYMCTAKWYSGEATFKHLVRVKSKLAPLWPAIGIIVEVLALFLIIILCGRKKKDSTPLAPPPSTSESNEKGGNRRKYVTTST
ncbi:neuroplastin-like [Mytilus trossulus]|uniref:neuroplastin-like n=1 Tax=Mytilus trossulus TaxID=6551 RepID=UPI00300544E3